MYNMRCSPRGEEERATRRASSPRLSKEFANREEDMRWWEGWRAGGKERNEHDSSRNHNYADFIHVCVFIYNIYIHNDVCTSKRSNFALSLK